MINCFNSLLIVLLLLITGCSKDSSDETPSIPSYTLTVNQSEGGTVNSSEGVFQNKNQMYYGRYYFRKYLEINDVRLKKNL